MDVTRLQVSIDARRFYLVLGSLILVAWGLLAVWQSSGYADLISHEALEAEGLPAGWRLGFFLLGWSLMTVAMMLPGSLPLLKRRLLPDRQQARGSQFSGLVVVGYLLPWVLYGVLVYLADSLLHHLAEPGASLARYSAAIAPAIVLMAGLYQLTPVKHRALMHCRLSRDGDPHGGASTLTQGLLLGVACVGNCWALMLLMFALGHNRLDWMLALGAIMAAERLAPWGERLAIWVGFALILWGIVWALI